jgi:OTT_1508-like deaminase
MPPKSPMMMMALKKLKNLRAGHLDTEPTLDKLVSLVQECDDVRRYLESEFLTKLAGTKNLERRNDILETRHSIGRLGCFYRLPTTLIEAVVEIPRITENISVKRCLRPNGAKAPLRAETTLEAIVGSMFSEESKKKAFLEKIKAIDTIANISGRIKDSCCFSTRVHAELQIADLFRSSGFEYFGGDNYIGCSKPSCFCCYHYLQALCPEVALDGSHNRVYIRWQPLEFGNDNEKRRALDALIQKVRMECSLQVNKRGSLGRHHDTRTGTFSEISKLDSEALPPATDEGLFLYMEEPMIWQLIVNSRRLR